VPRPCLRRNIRRDLGAAYFKPRGVPLMKLSEVALAADEFEALRLADRDGLYHQPAAKRLGVSRATFGNILRRARQKVADALVGQKALRLPGASLFRGGNP
jgi:predicted DNA-binding protein (UPF0251 family)